LSWPARWLGVSWACADEAASVAASIVAIAQRAFIEPRNPESTARILAAIGLKPEFFGF
jgi:hypothetical protein